LLTALSPTAGNVIDQLLEDLFCSRRLRDDRDTITMKAPRPVGGGTRTTQKGAPLN
jgi:hypothetical protein